MRPSKAARGRVVAVVAALALMVAGCALAASAGDQRATDGGLASQPSVSAPLPSSAVEDTSTPPPSTPATSSTDHSVTATPPPAPAAPGIPVQVRVPSHQLVASVQGHHINPDRTLYIPPNPKQVAWSMDDPRPGDPFGTVILTSHINYVINGVDVAGAFWDLASYRPGQQIIVVLGNGHQITYRVVQNLEYSKSYLAAHSAMWAQIFDETPGHSFGPLRKARLVLTSCSGPFDNNNGNYLDNSFVIAVQV